MFVVKVGSILRPRQEDQFLACEWIPCRSDDAVLSAPMRGQNLLSIRTEAGSDCRSAKIDGQIQSGARIRVPEMNDSISYLVDSRPKNPSALPNQHLVSIWRPTRSLDEVLVFLRFKHHLASAAIPKTPAPISADRHE